MSTSDLWPQNWDIQTDSCCLPSIVLPPTAWVIFFALQWLVDATFIEVRTPPVGKTWYTTRFQVWTCIEILFLMRADIIFVWLRLPRGRQRVLSYMSQEVFCSSTLLANVIDIAVAWHRRDWFSELSASSVRKSLSIDGSGDRFKCMLSDSYLESTSISLCNLSVARDRLAFFFIIDTGLFLYHPLVWVVRGERNTYQSQ